MHMFKAVIKQMQFFACTLPFRNLLLQLMQPVKPNRSAINETGAEMLINPDGLIFFRENGQLDFATYYPGT